MNQARLISAVVLLGACLMLGCKSTDYKNKARATAEAEYRCNKAKVISLTDNVVKLFVCGVLRWYQCSGCGLKTLCQCKEMKSKESGLFLESLCVQQLRAAKEALSACRSKGGTK